MRVFPEVEVACREVLSQAALRALQAESWLCLLSVGQAAAGR
ncbi:hypothetical protein [Candidatus Poriferisodalis sp.]